MQRSSLVFVVLIPLVLLVTIGLSACGGSSSVGVAPLTPGQMSNGSSQPTSAPQYTDAYGFTCSIAQAQPYGLCPTDHNERTGIPSFTDSSGVQCAFNVVDPSNGLCPLSGRCSECSEHRLRAFSAVA